MFDVFDGHFLSPPSGFSCVVIAYYVTTALLSRPQWQDGSGTNLSSGEHPLLSVMLGKKHHHHGVPTTPILGNPSPGGSIRSAHSSPTIAGANLHPLHPPSPLVRSGSVPGDGAALQRRWCCRQSSSSSFFTRNVSRCCCWGTQRHVAISVGHHPEAGARVSCSPPLALAGDIFDAFQGSLMRLQLSSIYLEVLT